ncbi:hypothetical protein [Deinococcus roseus]|uniref:Uncharacterized protein n=1 Tax=Deinococcus roseus TaxID=392414 RepID=A0ABQ2CWV1_9DEIO|nr:hypothetical protein [Deinococcus roseus]GGJ28612.1 hypothetical protein GCM10008938_13350 [Deinococcus roseus]
MTPSLKLSARWVPGTSNKLILHTPLGEYQISLDRFEQVFGRKATFALYLTGKTTLELPETSLHGLVA